MPEEFTPNNSQENEPNYDMTAEQRAIAEEMLPQYKNSEIPVENRTDHTELAAVLKSELVALEANVSWSALYAITNLTVEQAFAHPEREKAKKGLTHIFEMLTKLKSETNISTDVYDALYARYKTMSRAVGIINSQNEVDHTR